MARLNGEGSNPTTTLRRGLPLLVHKPGMSSCEEPDEVAYVLVNRVLADAKLMTVLDTFIAPRRVTVAAGRPWTKFRLAGDDRVRNTLPTATGPAASCGSGGVRYRAVRGPFPAGVAGTK